MTANARYADFSAVSTEPPSVRFDRLGNSTSRLKFAQFMACQSPAHLVSKELMNIEEVLSKHSKLEMPRPKVLRSYETFRERTVREFGEGLAYEIDVTIAAIFEVIVLKIAGNLDRLGAAATFQSHGWTPATDNQFVHCFSKYHDLAHVPQSLGRSGHSQFESAFFLKSLDNKYFDEIGERTTILTNSKVPGAMLAVSDLGDLPQPSFAFGLKAVLPHCADYLLWWALRSSALWSHFANPTDLGSNSWSVGQASTIDDRLRPFAKVALGEKNFQLGPSRSEECFYTAPFTAETDDELEVSQGSYLAYHSL